MDEEQAIRNELAEKLRKAFVLPRGRKTLVVVGLAFLDHAEEMMNAKKQYVYYTAPKDLEVIRNWIRGEGEAKACSAACSNAINTLDYIKSGKAAYYHYHGIFYLADQASVEDRPERHSVDMIVNVAEQAAMTVSALVPEGKGNAKTYLAARLSEYGWQVKNIHKIMDQSMPQFQIGKRRRLSPMAQPKDSGLSLD